MKVSALKWVWHAAAIAAFSLGSANYAAAQSVEEEFAREHKLVEALKVYNDQLAEQIQAQEQAKADIGQSITDSAGLAPQVGDLLNKMLAGLETFIKSDLPFHLSDRLGSVDQLKELMVAPEANMSDRFRNIMDVYTIEIEYGNTYEAYSDTINLNGEDIEVDMLRVGRLGLYYQTKDGNQSGMWDKGGQTFVDLPESSNRFIRTAIRVAAKLIAPELMNLEIPAPEGV